MNYPNKENILKKLSAKKLFNIVSSLLWNPLQKDAGNAEQNEYTVPFFIYIFSRDAH